MHMIYLVWPANNIMVYYIISLDGFEDQFPASPPKYSVPKESVRPAQGNHSNNRTEQNSFS